ncbi:MAG: hypothetical protein LBL58_19225 [Tannerellaceae bacterium]|jgi:hypothetical protein|nr:hypothetical protein [Tannerellaceae bacterium]
MSWKEQLSEIESHFGYHEKRDWRPAVELVKSLVEKYPYDVEVYIRTIYLIHNILVEEDYPNNEHDEMASLLKKYFDESYSLFSENTEYLFFIGEILHIAEWYFGLEDTILAIEMQKKAMEKEPGNLLYEWAYRLSYPGDIVAGYLANQLIEHEKGKVDWLKSKGFPGNYVLEHLQMSNQKYLEQKALE